MQLWNCAKINCCTKL